MGIGETAGCLEDRFAAGAVFLLMPSGIGVQGAPPAQSTHSQPGRPAGMTGPKQPSRLAVDAWVQLGLALAKSGEASDRHFARHVARFVKEMISTLPVEPLRS